MNANQCEKRKKQKITHFRLGHSFAMLYIVFLFFSKPSNQLSLPREQS